MVTRQYWVLEHEGSSPSYLIRLYILLLYLSFYYYFLMPQLIPFYFMNLLTFGIILISLLVYLVSTRILPQILKLLIARMLIVKL